jgi:hypothetical protein
MEGADLAAIFLASATLRYLVAKGVIDEDEVAVIVDTALITLERGGRTDAGTRGARKLLGAIQSAGFGLDSDMD